MIAREPLADPFCAEQILVQSPGMAQWLKLEIAQRLSIAANIDFPLPASFLWRTFSQLLSDVPEKSAYSKESMSWVLMGILPHHIEQPEFQTLASYMEGEQSPLKYYQLCAKIADLFDQYLVYRPDWIAQWETGENSPAEQEQLWQPILWRAIVENTQERGLPHWHRANMFDAFIEGIGSADQQALPQRVFVFGISALPENYLQALVALGKRCEIHLMVANPCRQYWSDIVDKRYLGKLLRRADNADQSKIDELKLYQQGNPLLASMGKLGRDYLHLLNQLDLPEVQLFSDDDNSSLLNALHSDILSLCNRRSELSSQQTTMSEAAHPRISISAADQSISFHSCHSAMREVEVLQDQLLGMLDDSDTLEPRDIIVMMPDVSFYSPFIEAVFGQASHEKYLPFSISDRNAQQESPLIANFLSILSLSQGRYAGSQVIELLSLPAIQRRLELDEKSFSLIRQWIISSGIKWGLDSQDRKELDLPQFDQNSWQFGLDRMFTGFALGDIEQTWQEIAPFPEIEGLDAAHLGQLDHFIEMLMRCKQQFQQSVDIDQWIAFFQQMLNELYDPNDNELAALEVIYSTLEKLQSTLSEVHYEQEIDAKIILDYLQQGLTVERSGQRFLSGQINFCTLMPMRAIPFNIVCLLGMNDSDYPRSVPAMGFDLMVEHSRKGDRSRRDDDRYLFLEALLSAQSKLYISYVGRSLADNSSRAPSVLVSELREYLQQGYYLENDKNLDQADDPILVVEQQGKSLLDHFTIEHMMTAYHSTNFLADSVQQSYAKQWLDIADIQANQQTAQSFLQPLESQVIDELTLKQLCSFYKQPIRYFFQHSLQVNFAAQEELVRDEEPFSLTGLESYIVRDKLLDRALRHQQPQQYAAFLQSVGLLPLGVAGDKHIAKNLHDATELSDKIEPLIKGELRRLSFDIPLDTLSLQGWIEPLFAAGVVKFSAGNSSGKHYISTWIEHLAACAAGCQHKTFFRAINEQFHFTPLAAEVAQGHLVDLIALYKQGLQMPLSWLPDQGWQLFNADDQEKAIQKIDKNYNLFDDPYLHRVFPRWQDIAPGLLAINEQIFEPLKAHLCIDTQESS
jgi:exodeoxyribonuclease V gamma subunit